MGGPGMGGPGGGGPGGGMSMPPVRVTFETAMPVAEAKKILDRTDAFAQLREQFVVVSVSGLRMMGGPRREPGSDTPPQPDPERMAEMQAQMQQRLLEATAITTKEKAAFRPSEVKISRSERGSVAFFAFDRKELNLDTKEITFKTSMGPMEISAKFNLKDMSVDGKPAL